MKWIIFCYHNLPLLTLSYTNHLSNSHHAKGKRQPSPHTVLLLQYHFMSIFYYRATSSLGPQQQQLLFLRATRSHFTFFHKASAQVMLSQIIYRLPSALLSLRILKHTCYKIKTTFPFSMQNIKQHFRFKTKVPNRKTQGKKNPQNLIRKGYLGLCHCRLPNTKEQTPSQ